MYKLPFLVTPPSWFLRKLFRTVSSAFSRCLFLASEISQISGHNNHQIEVAGSIPRKLHSRFSADSILISKSEPLSRAHEERSSSQDNIDCEEKREKAQNGTGGIFSSFLSLHVCVYVSRACTTHVPRERATDHARASKSNASASDTPGSRSFLRSYVELLARALCPSLSPWAFPVRLPRGLSFAPSLPTGRHTYSFTIVLSLVAFLSLLIFDADVLHPRRCFSLLLYRQNTTILVR